MNQLEIRIRSVSNGYWIETETSERDINRLIATSDPSLTQELGKLVGAIVPSDEDSVITVAVRPMHQSHPDEHNENMIGY